MIQFGPWSTLLAVLAGQILILAALLFIMRTNRLANLYLACLLLVVAGMLMPYVLDYAGFYVEDPWLTSAPFALPLALGPLLYAHVFALTTDRAPSWSHFAPPAVQFAYQATLFPFPVETKWWWDATGYQSFLEPVLAAAVLLSMAAYAVACWLQLGRYEAWLQERRRELKPLDTWDPSFRDWGAAASGPDRDGFYALNRKQDMAGSIKPRGRRFPGKLAILVDAACSSATFQFARAIELSGVATLIGEPTGGNRRGINGGAYFFFRLPQSGLEVDLPIIGSFPITREPTSGAMPDLHVVPEIDDVALGRDRALAAALKRMI